MVVAFSRGYQLAEEQYDKVDFFWQMENQWTDRLACQNSDLDGTENGAHITVGFTPSEIQDQNLNFIGLRDSFT